MGKGIARAGAVGHVGSAKEPVPVMVTDADRARIVEHCRRADEAQIVITHGTDTMVETASAIAEAVSGKTVVLTGAMIPYAFGSSDGLFNLGSALSFVQVLPPGVYIAMNGKRALGHSAPVNARRRHSCYVRCR